MSLKPKKGHVAVSILGVYTHICRLSKGSWNMNTFSQKVSWPWEISLYIMAIDLLWSTLNEVVALYHWFKCTQQYSQWSFIIRDWSLITGRGGGGRRLLFSPFNMAKPSSYHVKTNPQNMLCPPPPLAWLELFPPPFHMSKTSHAPPPLPFCSPLPVISDRSLKVTKLPVINDWPLTFTYVSFRP